MSDSENTYGYNDDDSSVMTNDSSDSFSNTFKPSIKIGKATTIKIDNINQDMDSLNDDNSYINEDSDDDDMPIAGDTEDEFEDSDDDDDSITIDEDGESIDSVKTTTPPPPPPGTVSPTIGDLLDTDEYADTKVDDDDDDDDSDDEEYDEDYLQKFDKEIINNYIVDFHPEAVSHNFDEVRTMSNVVRKDGIIVDKLHRTLPILTKFEKARILGIRAKQINDGAKSFLKTPAHIIDGYTIARMELAQKLMPFIIRRPLPNGGCEYWKIIDLELI